MRYIQDKVTSIIVERTISSVVVSPLPWIPELAFECHGFG